MGIIISFMYLAPLWIHKDISHQALLEITRVRNEMSKAKTENKSLEDARKKRSTDSSASLCSSVPEDLQIATPDAEPPKKIIKKSPAMRVRDLEKEVTAFGTELSNGYADLWERQKRQDQLVRDMEMTMIHLRGDFNELQKRFSQLEETLKSSSLPTRASATTSGAAAAMPALKRTNAVIMKPPASNLPAALAAKKDEKKKIEIPAYDPNEQF